VEAFYRALRGGDGDEAARFVIPRKRRSGPLSARAMSKFYGNLVEPLRLIDVVSIRPHEYRVRYTYVARGRKRCNSEAIVRTIDQNGRNLIESIKALDGC